MMKKSLLVALSLGAVSGVAHADVSLYGVLDVGVAQLTNAGDFSPTFVTGAVPIGAQPAKIGTARGMMNGGESQSRWGIKGSEDLGNGNKAFFQLESAFSVANGTLATSGLAGGAGSPSMIADTSLNGQLFNRMAFIGLSSNDLGAVTFGRQYSLQLDMIGSVGGGYDPVNAQMFSPINFSGSYGGGGATDNSRVDQAIKYSKKFGNFNVNAMYGFGGMAGNNSARSNAQLNAGYEADRFGVQAAVQNAKDTTLIAANTAPNTVNATFVNLTSYMLTGRYQVTDPLTLKAGYERMQYSAPGDPTGDAALTQIYQYNLGTRGMFTGQKNINVVWVGANYQITPAMKASVGYYDVMIPAFTGTGGTTMDSTDKYTSAMLEYNLSKNTNLYAAFMLDKKNGLAAIGANLPTNYNTYGAGVRVKF
ncbi:MAG: porin [Gallionella sp.]